MGGQKPIPLTLYLPDTPEGLAQLARRTAAVHADLTLGQIKLHPCPAHQKKALVETVIRAVSQENSGLHSEQLQFDIPPPV